MNFDCCLSGEVTYSINVLCNQGVPYSSFKNELAESVYDLQNILEWKALRTLDVSTLPVRHLVMERNCAGANAGQQAEWGSVMPQNVWVSETITSKGGCATLLTNIF